MFNYNQLSTEAIRRASDTRCGLPVFIDELEDYPRGKKNIFSVEYRHEDNYLDLATVVVFPEQGQIYCTCHQHDEYGELCCHIATVLEFAELKYLRPNAPVSAQRQLEEILKPYFVEVELKVARNEAEKLLALREKYHNRNWQTHHTSQKEF